MTQEDEAQYAAWLDSDERRELLRYLRAQLPAWVTVGMHTLLAFTAVIAIGIAVVAYRTLESSVRSEVLLTQAVNAAQAGANDTRLLRVFFDSTLEAAQRRADSLRVMRDRQIDSLRALRQR
jgi:hypothetical protein